MSTSHRGPLRHRLTDSRFCPSWALFRFCLHLLTPLLFTPSHPVFQCAPGGYGPANFWREGGTFWLEVFSVFDLFLANSLLGAKGIATRGSWHYY